MAKKKNKLALRMTTALLVVAFSIVLFVNNMTQFLDKVGYSYQITIIAWVGIVGSLLYAILKAMKGEL